MTYTGSPNSYFKKLPNLDYPSLANERKSAYDYQVVKNIFKKAVIRDDIFDEVTAFTKYSVEGDERPDQVAYNFYGDSGLDWVILTTNNIVHVRDEWPMGSQDFFTYVNAKYTSEQLSKNNDKNSLFKISIFLFSSFKLISCSKKENDVNFDSVLKTPLSRKVIECPSGTVKPAG